MAESRESPQLNAKHRQMNPGFSTRYCAFVVSHKTSMPHEPAKRALDNPPPRQYREAFGRRGALDDLHFELGPVIADPLFKGFSGIAAVYPQLTQFGEPSFDPLQDLLSPVSLRTTSRCNDHAQQQSQGIHQNVPLASVDLFAGIKPDLAPVAVGFDALTVQDGSSGLGVSLLVGTHAGTQRVIESRPSVVQAPPPEDVIDSLPRGIVLWQKPPWNAPFEDIQDRIEHAPAIRWRSAAPFGFRKHRLKKFPLRVGEFRFVGSDIHRPDSGCAESVERRPNASCQCDS